MKQILLFFLVLPVLLSGQSVPDFTMTDIQGQVHSLYPDYLNHGKTVMLEIFHSNCPPCNSQADAVQSLYQVWGEGSGDVEFIGISSQAWETNQTAQGYVDNHHITFPTISAAGGSVGVFNAYRNSGFGPYYGTPTYLVIAPDGKIQWDVALSSLDAALIATGASKPGTTGTGQVNRQKDFWIAPNPSDGILNIYQQGFFGEHPVVSIYSIVGEKLYTYYPTRGDGDLLLQVDAGSWFSGTYLVRIENEGTVMKTMRFVRK